MRTSTCQRFFLALAIAIAATLPLARAQTAAPAAKPAIAAASVRWLCTGRCRGFTGHPEVVDPVQLTCDDCLVLGLISQAYGLPESQFENAPEWGAWDRYNFRIASDSPVSRSQMTQGLLRRVLAQCFSLRVRTVTKTVPGWALVVAPGGIKFPAVKKRPAFGPPNHGIATVATLPNLAGFLSEMYYFGKQFGVNRPVRDATGLKGFYRIPFPVFATDPATNLIAALGPLGLEVKPEQGTDTRLKILHFDQLRTNCELGPEGARVGS